MSKISAQPVTSFEYKYVLSRAARQLWEQYSREEGIVHGFIGLILVIGCAILTINHFYFHNTVWDIANGVYTTIPILVVVWWFIAQFHRQKWPRFSLVVITICNSTLFISVTTIACLGILTTPFNIIDHHLVKLDLWMGFDVTVFMAWVYQHPIVERVLSFAYNTWYFQIPLAPIVLALLKKSDEVHRYFMGYALYFLMAALIYYFFPTIAPAGVMQSPHFLANQHELVLRFNEIHQHLPVSFHRGGLIAFPSVHVTTALTVLIAFRKIKPIFYPMLIINALLIVATMGLGYHYLSDVIMSFIVVAISCVIIHFIYAKFVKKDLFFNSYSSLKP